MVSRTPARLAVTALAFVAYAAPVLAQQGSGDGFLFRAPRATLTAHGGFAQPMATGGVFSLATDELTLGRSDFGSGNFGVDLAVSIAPRFELVFGVDRSSSSTRSEYREWVDNNSEPIEQRTRLQRTPFMAGMRYYLSDRGRRIGSVAWVPARFTPFVSASAGVVNYKFEQAGDFIDTQTLVVFGDRLTSSGWTKAFQGGAGAQWNLNQRVNLTGEVRYLHANGEGDEPFGDFSGYKVNLSGVSTLIGITLRL